MAFDSSGPDSTKVREYDYLELVMGISTYLGWICFNSYYSNIRIHVYVFIYNRKEIMPSNKKPTNPKNPMPTKKAPYKGKRGC